MFYFWFWLFYQPKKDDDKFIESNNPPKLQPDKSHEKITIISLFYLTFESKYYSIYIITRQIASRNIAKNASHYARIDYRVKPRV